MIATGEQIRTILKKNIMELILVGLVIILGYRIRNDNGHHLG